MLVWFPLWLKPILCAQVNPQETTWEAVKQLAEKYQIEISWKQLYPQKRGWGEIRGFNPKQQDVEHYLPLLLSEFNLYSRSFVSKTNLKKIVIGEKLGIDSQKRAAIPDTELGTLYLDLNPPCSSPEYLKHVLHHDFFHLVEESSPGNCIKNADWVRLNPPGFQYGDGGASIQNTCISWNLNSAHPGFANMYSKSASREDRAEIYSFLMTELHAMTKIAVNDKILDAKMKRMKSCLAKLDESFDDSFWENVGKTRHAVSTRKEEKSSSPPAHSRTRSRKPRQRYLGR